MRRLLIALACLSAAACGSPAAPTTATTSENLVLRLQSDHFRMLPIGYPTSNADLTGTLGVSAEEFERAWQAWVRERYLL